MFSCGLLMQYFDDGCLDDDVYGAVMMAAGLINLAAE
jgi:hypothetical protein